MITTNLVFDHRNRTAPGHEGPVEVRICIDRKLSYINTGVRVRASEWRAGSVVNRTDSKELNERIDIIFCKVQQLVNVCVRENRPIDAAWIRKNISATIDQRSFLEWLEEQIPQLPIQPQTKKHYSTLLKVLSEWGMIEQWSDITTERIFLFDSHLHTKNLEQGSIYNYHKNLKAILSRAVKVGMLNSSPYSMLRNEFKRGQQPVTAYLTDDEMETLKNMELPDGQMKTARDLFVFQMYTGLSYSDTQTFSLDDYHIVNGRWICNAERIKTGVPYVSNLLPPALEVVDRYNGRAPKIANQRYNLLLKCIGPLAGIRTHLHSHLARHTFATWMLRNGSSIENVSKMLGHTDISTTQRYAKVVAQSVHDDFDRMAELLKKK